MNNFFFIALMALVICSCSCNVVNQQSSAVAEQPQVYRANVLRVQHIIESLAHSSCSRTIVLLDDGNIFSAVDEYNEDVALLREGDEVTYTKRSNGKVDEVVRCLYQRAKVSDE